MFNDPDIPEEDTEFSIKCKYCGKAGLYWEQEKGKWILIDSFDDNKHVCIKDLNKERQG